MYKHSRLIGIACCFGLFLFSMKIAYVQEPKTKRAVDFILEAEQQLIKRGKLEERRRAAEELRRVSERLADAATALSSYGLSDPDDEVRLNAAKALSQLGGYGFRSGAAVPNLADILETDRVPEIRSAAASALGSIFLGGSNPIHAEEGIPALVRAMRQDTHPLVRRNACSTFRVIGPLGKIAAPDLVEIIKAKDDMIMREVACYSLVGVACPEVKHILPALLDIYKKEKLDSYHIKGTILAVLGKIGDKEEIIVPLLIDNLKKSKVSELRSWAVLGLQHLGAKGKSAVPTLIDALDVSNFTDRNAARSFQDGVVIALGKIGPDAKAAIPALRILAETDEGRFEAERALRLIENK